MKTFFIFSLITLICTAGFSQQDAEGTKDHPMFPTRMSNYFITEITSNFDAVNFNMADGGSQVISKEGTKTIIRYDFDASSGLSKPSPLQILRNYEAAVKKIGGVTKYLSAPENTSTFKIIKPGSEVWVKVECFGDDNNDFYELTILEIELMKQEVNANDMLSTLNIEGRISLYINFDTGKSDIKPESENAINQIVEMMNADPELKISIEGHTDADGNTESNQALSESRALAIMNALIAKGIDKSRLSTKGWGQTKPLVENTTEDGKATNRRVEIVKI